jgi:hypothetical protein
MRRVGAGAAREHLDAFGHHEGRVEADAEAADQRRVLVVFGCFKPIDERLGAGARAMVPSDSISSSRLMPMPLSSIMSCRCSASTVIVMRGFGSSPRSAGSAIAQLPHLRGQHASAG